MSWGMIGVYMTEFRFSLIVPASQMTDEQILDIADGLAQAGCVDASVCGHAEGMELVFDREADSLQAALSSAVSDVERAGHRVSRVEMLREAIPA